jgi:hypothetical protein
VSKGLDFGVFGALGLEVSWRDLFDSSHDLAIIGGQNLSYGVHMRCSYYPESLAQIHGAIREIRSWIWGS